MTVVSSLITIIITLMMIYFPLLWKAAIIIALITIIITIMSILCADPLQVVRYLFPHRGVSFTLCYSAFTLPSAFDSSRRDASAPYLL